jgi:sugar transferase (PEP-CTERM system associated)
MREQGKDAYVSAAVAHLGPRRHCYFCIESAATIAPQMTRLFRVLVPGGVLALILCDAALTAACFLLAPLLIPFGPSAFSPQDRLERLGFVVASIVTSLYLSDLYSKVHVRSKTALGQQLVLILGLAFIGQALVSYFWPDLRIPFRTMVVGSALTLLTLFAWRCFYSSYILNAVGGKRVLFVGWNEIVQEIAAHMASHPELGFEGIGYLKPEPGAPANAANADSRCLGAVQDLRTVVSKTRPDWLIVGITERRRNMPLTDLLDLRFAGFVIEEASAAYESVCGRISTKELRPAQLIFSGELGPASKTLFIQAIFNLALALAVTIVTLPVMLLAALAVRLTSPGPALYRQTRVGLYGAPFTIYKFRSMYRDAEAGTGAVWAKKNDPRVTPLGRFLRKTRIDELPQLFNVLGGDMSIVGPRPERPEFVKTHIGQIRYYAQRHSVKPGITGWAQINHKYGDTMEDVVKKLEYDLYYIKNMSLALDTYIIFHTAKTMLLSRGSQ